MLAFLRQWEHEGVGGGGSALFQLMHTGFNHHRQEDVS